MLTFQSRKWAGGSSASARCRMRWARYAARVAVSVGAGVLLSALAPALSAAGADTNRGFYVGVDVGVSAATTLESTRTNFGIPTNCDQWLEPVIIEGLQLPLPADQCQPRELPSSANGFALGSGVLAGINLGYSGFGPFRVEIEYFRHRRSGDKVNLVVPGDPKQREFSVREEEIGAFRTDNIFANLYYDFAAVGSMPFTPFVGVGVGTSRVAIDYSATSIRRDEAALLALAPPRHPDAANKVSHANTNASDHLWGFQLVVGADYALKTGHLVTGKLRYGRAMDDFLDGGNAWRSLRGHESTVAPGGAPVHYSLSFPGPSFWAISIGFKVEL